ncbi:tetracycline resistance protein, class C [Acinetobacter baumannii 25493_8]|uniref:TCR/Tet family MFS transporter n=1 Tax=Acinetobacter baumannii TaxID=470 RepID=UPI000452AAD0|nr:tetracycline resistance MFS efflux pump [Acinetobacter baumannii]EXQ86223.1 tetracycline resistance protein, class C [Acinetobacter baumannii 1058283]EYD34871.1 tetracycline resistance protein, class C [Acinetobacter baumannii 25493_8]EYD44909.1 tetracycline resistance protein, class C [Acinetobacter baumannii 25493_6]EYD64817.1 tetracycline resistance protein, class C [Acinetobacter baumannii 25493_1]EYD65901.1 tetracycline resistance protein, class C [Acinetobacter baumannii 25493_10]
MNRSLFIIFATIALDAIGIGLIFPILPLLLQDMTHSTHIAIYMGILASLYAAMQFIFSPLLGALSDRWGRRPVLLISLAGAAINYLFLTFSHSLILLLVGRIIAGITSANMAVASTYIVDVSQENNRAKYFGLINAMFGAGFIIGPVLGGFLSEYGLRLPFLVAAILTGLNLLFAYFILPETRRVTSEGKQLSTLNPFKIFAGISSIRGVLPFVMTFFIFSAIGEVYGVCWALWGHDTFQWSGFWVGLSLGAFGLCQMLVQALIPSHASRLLGNRNAVLIGIACSCLALAVMAFAQSGWMIFAIMPIFALGSMGTPSLQALASQKVSADQQGQFQGVIASTVSMASMIAPMFFSTLYFQFQEKWPGAIWLSVILIYLITLPIILYSTRPVVQQR